MEIPALIRSRKTVSKYLEKFRIAPRDPQLHLPRFEAGQALELIAPRVRLVRRMHDAVRSERYVFERDAAGTVLVGRLALWYSIASSPEEAAASGELEFFVGLHDVEGEPPRFLLNGGGESLFYGDRPDGDFTMAGRTRDARQVVIAATGTGVAPVVSMMKHLQAEAVAGRRTNTVVTLIHGHRTVAELGYLDDLRVIERSRSFDFLYLPMLTRIPAEAMPAVGFGRVTDAVRSALGAELPVRFPQGLQADALRRRMSGEGTVILACGGAAMLGEMASIAGEAGIRFEQEGW